MREKDSVRAVRWANDRLQLLDQRRLPDHEEYLDYDHVDQVAAAITDMVVRGAPAIGVTAAYGAVLAARQRYRENRAQWKAAVRSDLERLGTARPTAVNLAWAVARMQRLVDTLEGDPESPMLHEAKRIHEEDIQANYRMGEFGAALLDGDSVLTHCNAGALATGGYGTALGVVRSGFVGGKITRVYADETRPWLQGARLTAWELVQDGIPVCLLCEGAAASLMAQGRVRWVIVGADRVAANGDVANKIGTYQLAVMARHHGVQFMVVAPSSTIDMDTPTGAGIPVETRSSDEVLSFHGESVAPSGVDAWNPVFDITPAEFVSVLVTERGVVHAPDASKLAALMP